MLNSRLYKLKNAPKVYSGYLVVPNNRIEQIRDYFNQCENKRILTLIEFSEITNAYETTSLALYKPEKGWLDSPPPELKRLTIPLGKKRFQKRDTKLPTFFRTATFDPDWSYLQYPVPADAITLYCKACKRYAYTDLPFSSLFNSLDSV